MMLLSSRLFMPVGQIHKAGELELTDRHYGAHNCKEASKC